MPTSTIAPEHLDLLVAEMADLGRAYANALVVQAARHARQSRDNSRGPTGAS
jgi:hypothetical protein